MKREKKTISNIEVSRDNRYSNYSLSCVFDGARYHIWFDGKTRVKLPILYKNSLAEYKTPEYFSTRQLGVHTAFGSTLISAMLTYANDHKLFDLADERVQEQERQESEQAKAYRRKKQIQEAATDLYAALEMAEGFMSGFEDDEAQDGINEKLSLVRAALNKARGAK